MSYTKPDPFTYEQAYHYALRLLNQRSYSVARLRQKILLKGTPTEDCETILRECLRLRLLDDNRYAQSVMRTEATYRRSSNRMIEAKLKQKGVTPSQATAALLAQNDEVPGEEERAVYHASKYLERHTSLPVFVQRQKVSGHLYRKGFSTSVIQRVLSTLESKKPELAE